MTKASTDPASTALPAPTATRFRGPINNLVSPDGRQAVIPVPESPDAPTGPQIAHGHVELWRRPTHIEGEYAFANHLGIDHYWIKTDKYEAGMGGTAAVIPGQGAADELFSPTQTVDHTGQSKAPDAEKVNIPFAVDEACVDPLIKPGQKTGKFIPGVNDCAEFSAKVLNQCRVDSKRKTFDFE